MTRMLHAAFVIARRDFTATVLSKAFIFFLLGPMFPLLLGGVFGGIGAQVASRSERPTIAVALPSADFERVVKAQERLSTGIGDAKMVRLVYTAPPRSGVDPERQLQHDSLRALGLLTGSLDKAQLTGSVARDDPLIDQMRLLLDDARLHRSDVPPGTLRVVTVSHPTEGARDADLAQTAQIGQVLLFFLTLMLSTMVLSQLIEEKSNKVIEIIAAAVPIDAMFVGKLFAMLAASVLALVVWISAGALLIQMLTSGGLRTLPTPAVGWPAFLTLGVVYFGMNYLLFGAVFLVIGAQASTAREVQTMSLPATFGQVLIFGLASTVINAPNSNSGLAASAFPLSSPMAMLARAAERPEFWPHLVALLWQGLWVVIILRFGAQLFRKTVLKSGPKTAWWKFGRA